MSGHVIIYSDGTEVVELHVPWGFHSGNRPPPVIEFPPRQFLYSGDGDETGADLTTLRAKVVAMRDKEDGPHEQCCTQHALDRVLDLIDKHAREGQ